MLELRLATRASALALWQARFVGKALEALGARVELVRVHTQGDRDRRPFSALDGQGFFAGAVQASVLNGEADLAVHSYKDLPVVSPPGLVIAAVLGRIDPRDCLVIRSEVYDPSASYLNIKPGARVGTSAARRQAQLAVFRPDLTVLELRGNIPFRLAAVQRGTYDAVLLAAAGLKRLEPDLEQLHAQLLPPEVFVPAPAQGVIAVECRAGDPAVRTLLAGLDQPEERVLVEEERRLMGRLVGGCQLALGAHARRMRDEVEFIAWYGGQTYKVTAAGAVGLAGEVFERIRADHPTVEEQVRR